MLFIPFTKNIHKISGLRSDDVFRSPDPVKRMTNRLARLDGCINIKYTSAGDICRRGLNDHLHSRWHEFAAKGRKGIRAPLPYR